MPKVIKVKLSGDQRSELNRLSLLPELAPRFRQRLEMVRLSDVGLIITQIAATLECHHQTVGKFLNAFVKGGFEALKDKPHPGPAPKLLQEHLVALEAELYRAATTGARTYTMPQLVEWLYTHYGVVVSKGHLTRVLLARGYRYKRTKNTLIHKKVDSQLQAAKEADLATLT